MIVSKRYAAVSFVICQVILFFYSAGGAASGEQTAAVDCCLRQSATEQSLDSIRNLKSRMECQSEADALMATFSSAIKSISNARDLYVLAYQNASREVDREEAITKATAAAKADPDVTYKKITGRFLHKQFEIQTLSQISTSTEPQIRISWSSGDAGLTGETSRLRAQFQAPLEAFINDPSFFKYLKVTTCDKGICPASENLPALVSDHCQNQVAFSLANVSSVNLTAKARTSIDARMNSRLEEQMAEDEKWDNEMIRKQNFERQTKLAELQKEEKERQLIWQRLARTGSVDKNLSLAELRHLESMAVAEEEKIAKRAQEEKERREIILELQAAGNSPSTEADIATLRRFREQLIAEKKQADKAAMREKIRREKVREHIGRGEAISPNISLGDLNAIEAFEAAKGGSDYHGPGSPYTIREVDNGVWQLVAPSGQVVHTYSGAKFFGGQAFDRAKKAAQSLQGTDLRPAVIPLH